MSDARFPAGACDTHMHLYDRRYPIAATTVLRPPDASVAEYCRFRSTLGLDRVVVVQPTTYGLDNTCLLAGLAELGVLGVEARAVVVVDERVTGAELAHLHALGVRGARFHLLPGGALGWDALAAVAARVAPLGWLVQVQMNGRDLPDRLAALGALPTPLVIDHVGRFMPPVTPADPAFAALLGLVDAGRCWVRLSGPYESAVDPAHRYVHVGELARALVRHAPERLLWASNWPHPSLSEAPAPSDQVRLAQEWMADPVVRRRIMVDNPAALYGFDPLPSP